MLHGDLSKNYRLQDDDIIKINVYNCRVSIEGAIKRSAVYEIEPQNGLKELVEIAGGFTETAYRDLIRVIRIGKKEKEIINVTSEAFPHFALSQGDIIKVDEIADKFSNKINIDGAVYYPGIYSLSEYSNLQTLLQKVSLKENAYIKRGVINRKDSTFQPEAIDFSVADVITGKTIINLKKEDNVHVYSIDELKEAYTVSINGEVLKPGSFNFVDNLSLQELILLAGGFKEGASNKRIEISRRIRTGTDSEMEQYAIVETIELNKNLTFAKDFAPVKLQPFDIISVRKDPSYKEQGNIMVEGYVLYPGNYTVIKEKERLSDLIQRAGGFRKEAYPKGAVLIRSKTEQTNSKIQEIQQTNLLGKSDSLKSLNSDSLNNKINVSTSSVGIKLDEAVLHPGSKYDIMVAEGDVLSVPRKVETVKTTTGVYLPKQIVFDADKKFRDYINESGGFIHSVQRNRSFVLYANGEVAKTHHFLFFKQYPKIEPGSEIYVPLKKSRNNNRSGIGEAASLTALIGSIATTFWILKSL